MNPRVNLLAPAVILWFFLVGAGSLLIGWVQAGRVDLLPTVILTGLGLIGGLVLALLYRTMTHRRGIVFFGTFFGLIVLPQFAAYVVLGPQAWNKSSQQQPASPPGIDVPTLIVEKGHIKPGILIMHLRCLWRVCRRGRRRYDVGVHPRQGVAESSRAPWRSLPCWP